MPSSSFHVIATAALLFTTNALQAREPASAESPPAPEVLRESDEHCISSAVSDANTHLAASEPADPKFPTPSYVVASQGQLGYLEGAISLSPDCGDGICAGSVIFGYSLPALDPVQLEFRLEYAPRDTQVTVGLLNWTTDQFDLFDVEASEADGLMHNTTTSLPVGRADYRWCNWVEIEVRLKWPACPECTGSDTVSIRDVTLGPT